VSGNRQGSWWYAGPYIFGFVVYRPFYLPPALRNNGLGTTILALFENEGRKRGCIADFLYTITFQAPDFYKKHGWEEFGRIDCLPEGTSRIFMKKSFS
jgi:GNAT superfamily N-acetyltransferase